MGAGHSPGHPVPTPDERRGLGLRFLHVLGGISHLDSEPIGTAGYRHDAPKGHLQSRPGYFAAAVL